MNNAIELAQERVGKVTVKQLRAVIRQGDRHFMHGMAVLDRPSWSDAFTFTFSSVKTAKNSSRYERTTTCEIPGWVSNGYTSERKEHNHEGRKWTTFSDRAYRPSKGFWSLWGIERVRDILECLPGDATVSFHVSLDAGSNELCVMADCAMTYIHEKGLHADHLYLVAETRKGERRFLVDATVSAHNTARFGAGA